MKIRYDSQKTPYQIENINYLVVERPQNYTFSFPEGRRQNSFLYTASGTLEYTFTSPRKETLIANSGDLVFIPKGSVYKSLYVASQNTLKLVQFDILSGELPSELSTPTLLNHNKIEVLFSSLCQELQSGMANDPIYLLFKMYELLWNISEHTKKIPNKYRKLQAVLKEIHLYYADQQKMQYYADLCGMSEAGFRRLFKEFTGLSPIEYRNQLRLQEAKKLLASGEFSVEEASLQVGFSNLSFFSRSYKKQFGNSPRKDS